MIKYIKKLLQKPLAQEIVETSLEEYQRQLLSHQAATEYHKKMSEYYSEGVMRLQRFKPVPARVSLGT